MKIFIRSGKAAIIIFCQTEQICSRSDALKSKMQIMQWMFAIYPNHFLTPCIPHLVIFMSIMIILNCALKINSIAFRFSSLRQYLHLLDALSLSLSLLIHDSIDDDRKFIADSLKARNFLHFFVLNWTSLRDVEWVRGITQWD